MKLKEDDIDCIVFWFENGSDEYISGENYYKYDTSRTKLFKLKDGELKQQILENQRLRELVEERVEYLNKIKKQIGSKLDTLELSLLQSLLNKAKEK